MIKTALNCAGAIWLFVMLSPTGFSESAGGQAPPWLSPKQSVFAIEPAVIWEADVIGEPPSKRVRWKLGYGKTVIAEGKLELDSLDDPVQIRFLCPSELQQRATNFKLVFQWQAEDRELLASSLNQISFSLTLLPQNVTRVLGVPNHRPLVADSSDNLKKQLKRIGIDYRSVRLAHLHQTKTKVACHLLNAENLSSQSLQEIILNAPVRRIVVLGKRTTDLDLSLSVQQLSYARGLAGISPTYLPSLPNCFERETLPGAFSLDCSPNSISLTYGHHADWSWCVLGLKQENPERASQIIFLPIDLSNENQQSPLTDYLLASTLFFED